MLLTSGTTYHTHMTLFMLAVAVSTGCPMCYDSNWTTCITLGMRRTHKYFGVVSGEVYSRSNGIKKGSGAIEFGDATKILQWSSA